MKQPIQRNIDKGALAEERRAQFIKIKCVALQALHRDESGTVPTRGL